MAEITNNFLQGKMNKDLDERIIPKGQYREAMNIQISTSEGSDVGSAQNIRGTELLSAVGAHVVGEEHTVCVGSIEDTLTNHIYYFNRAVDRDFIVKYDVTNDASSFLVVDLGRYRDYVEPFLNFSGKPLTAINIIDNFLYFTDGENEPKRIDLSKDYTGDLNNPLHNFKHSKFRVDGVDYGYLQEEHVTVIRKKPLRAPQIKINSSKNDTSKSIFERQIPRFCIRYIYDDSQVSAFSPFTQPVFNAEYIEDYNQNNFYDKAEAYNTAMLNYIKSIEVYGFIDDSMPKDVVEVEILYKTEDSNVVYSVAKIKKSDSSWSAIGSYLQDNDLDGYYLDTSGYYLIDSENIYAAIAEEQLLRPYDNVPRKAHAQEITGNRIVYGNYTQNYDVDTVSLTASTVTRDQEDNKPYKSIKSQRSYQVGLLFGDAYGRETPIFTSENASIKTIQNLSTEVPLQISTTIDSSIPSWAHYYKFYVKESSGRYYNLLNERLYVPFKHSQFENEEDHVYLSFPSKDRSKLSEDDYIILKTVLKEPESFRVTEDNKYKILDISNEAPEAIAYKFYDLGSGNNDSNKFTSTDQNDLGLFVDDPSDGETRRIDQQTDTIVIRKSVWQDDTIDGSALTNSEGGAAETSNKIENLYMSWSLDGIQSERYKITNIRVSTTGNYVIRLSEVIRLQDALLANSSALTSNGELQAPQAMPEGLNFKIQRKDRYSNENFSGSFFVKIAADDLIKEQLLNQPAVITATDKILHSEKVYLWLDEASTTYSTTKNASVQYASEITSNYYGGSAETPVDIHGGDGLTDKEEEWSKLLEENLGFGESQGKFFIDGMYMAASNPSSTLYARESGQGWVGSPIIRYPKLVWAAATPNSNVNNLNNESNTNINAYENYSATFASNLAATANWGWMLENYTDFNTVEPNEYGFPPSNYDTTSMDASTDIAFAPDDDGDEEDYYVNGIDPIIIANGDYYGSTSDGSGGRIWCNSTIYGSDRVNDLSNDYEQGGFYMHVSFLGPGVDLFTREDSYNTNIPFTGPNCLAKYLQGIWGGGAFNHGTGTGFVEMENHSYISTMYGGSTTNHYIQPAPGVEQFMGNAAGIQYSVLTGYDPEYQTQHERQFDPLYGAEDVAAIQQMLDNLVAGKRFRFSQDDSEEIYTILNVEVKNVYNHTPWRMRKVWNGTEYVNGGDSVEEAVIAWAENGTATNNSKFNGDTDADGNILPDTGVLGKLESFGARSNRRVVYALKLDKNPQASASFKPLSQSNTNFDVNSSNSLFEFIEESAKSFSSEASTNKAIFETEPEKAVDLDIYYEISDAIPTKITAQNKDILFPIGSIVEIINFEKAIDGIESPKTRYIRQAFYNEDTNEQNISISGESNAEHGFNWFDPADGTTELDYVGKILAIKRRDGSVVHVEITERNSTSDYYITGAGSGNYGYARSFKIKLVSSLPYYSNFYNVFGFGNGVESNSIRDDFNGVAIKTGARASTTLDEPYKEETRKHGLIFSGLYNSNTGLNNLNQFIQAQKITKDLNPTYGSIQKLFQRQTNLVVFCEDKVVKVLSNKDAVFNADGNPQLVANEKVLGQVTPFVGEFGISKNPESFASESYRAYFTDKQRRAVLRLSMDGLTPISDAGMKDWFGDNLEEDNIFCLGTYDEDKQEYNLTLGGQTYNENLVSNAYFDDGVPLVETQFGSELFSVPFNGAEYTDIDIASTDIYDTKGTISREANVTGTVQNHVNVSLDTSIVEGNWYMVEIEVPDSEDSSGNVVSLGPPPDTDIFVFLVKNALAGHPEIHGSNQNDADFRETLPYHFGQVSGGGQTAVDLKLLPARRYWDGSKKRIILGIWKAYADSTTFTLNSWVSDANSTNDGFTGLSLTLYDITERPDMTMSGNFPTGYIDLNGFYLGNPPSFYVPHAAYPYIQEFYQNAGPNTYYRNNAIQINIFSGDENFLYNAMSVNEIVASGGSNSVGGFYPLIFNNNSSSISVLEQLGGIYHPPATPNGFNLYFTVGENVDTESLSGQLQVKVRLPLEQGNIAGFTLSNITEPGVYGINYNYLAGYNTTIITQPEGSDVQLSGAQVTNSPNAINFRADETTGFVGSISNLSLRDATPSFTGGGADSWTFGGFDTSVRNDLYWDPSNPFVAGGSLVWKDIDLQASPNGISAEQYIGELATGDKYELSFRYRDLRGQLVIYYFNSSGYGAIWGVGSASVGGVADEIPSNGFYSEINALDTNYIGTGISVPLQNTLVFVFQNFDTNTSTSNDGATARIDNIVLKRASDYKPKTLSYSEDVKGWVSFKSFIPESGLSLGGDYYTFKRGCIHKHHVKDDDHNNFYRDGSKASYIDFIFNDSSSVIKDFKTLSYEGSASKRLQYSNHQGGATDINYNNLSDRDGWFVSKIKTDLQKGSVPEFIKKEGKYYNYIRGGNIDVTNSDNIGNLNVQGIGIIRSVEYDEIEVDD